MKRPLLAILFTFSIIPLIGISQVGATCEEARTKPIKLPFTDRNTTCGKGNELLFATMPCVNDYNEINGADSHYFFVAEETGIVFIGMEVINFTGGSPVLALTKSCPTDSGLSSCIFIKARVQYIDDGKRSAYFSVIKGEEYMITLDQIAWAGNSTPPCYSYNIDVKMVPESIPNNVCTNADFESGKLNGWIARYGVIQPGLSSARTPNFSLTGIGAVRNRHEIETGGVDMYGKFPKVSPGGKYSVRIGNDSLFGMKEGEQIRQTFIVDSVNTFYTYKYAVVFQVPRHVPNEQPFFKAQMYDKYGNPISCSEYIVAASQNIPGFEKADRWPDIYFKKWTTVAIDLKKYINQPVTLEFTVGDCSQGGHFGYAYIDGTCLPSSNLGKRDTICLGSTKKLRAPDGFASYLWQPGGETTQEINAAEAGIYTVNMNSYMGCTVTMKDTLVVLDIPKFKISSKQLSCEEGIRFSAAPLTPGKIGNLFFQWDFGQGAVPRLSNDTVVNVKFKTPGERIVLLTIQSPSGCTDSIIEKFKHKPCSFSVNLDNVNICKEGCITLRPEVNLGTPPFTYKWSPGIDGQNELYTVCPSGDSTLYTIVVKDAKGLIDSASGWVIRNNSISLITSKKNIGCSGKNDGWAKVSVSGGVPPFRYQWNTGSTDSINSLLAPGTYTVFVTDALGCTDSATVLISKNTSQLDVRIDKDSVFVCNGQSTQLIASGAESYQWYPTLGLNTNSGDIVQARPGVSTRYTVVGTDEFGCTDTSYATVQVSSHIQTSFTTLKPTCLLNDGSIATKISGGTAPYTFNWSNGEKTQSLSGLKVGTFFLTTADALGCIRNDTVILTNINKGFPVSMLAEKDKICYGDSIFLGTTTGGQKRWFLDGLAIGNQNRLEFKPERSAKYVVIVTDSIGCIDSSSQYITVHPNPSLTVNASKTSICPTESVIISASGASTYYWRSSLGTYQGSFLQLKTKDTEVVQVIGKDSNGCWSDTSNIKITVHPSPFVEIGNDTLIEKGTVVTMHPAFSPNTIKWDWHPDLNINCTNCPQPSITLQKTSKYFLTVTNNFGCSAIDSIRFYLTCSGNYVQFPNVFSPNGDGNNDFFRPLISAELIVRKLQIFNRWGELMFFVKDHDLRLQPLKGWDGKYKGILQSQDSYVFTMEVECPTGELNYYKGSFLLIN